MTLLPAAGAGEAEEEEEEENFSIPEDEAEAAEYRRAITIVQRALRSRKLRNLWPNMEQLRAKFLDPKAIAAGAASSPWYSNFGLAIREGLRYAPEVVQALQSAWKTITTATGTEHISKEDYITMMRKLYLAIKLHEGDFEVDADDMLASLDDDWAEDADGKDYITESAFHRCWFQVRMRGDARLLIPAPVALTCRAREQRARAPQ